MEGGALFVEGGGEGVVGGGGAVGEGGEGEVEGADADADEVVWLVGVGGGQVGHRGCCLPRGRG